MRFIVDYDTTINKNLKLYLIDNFNPSMYSVDSVQYCLVDLLNFMEDNNLINQYISDYQYLKSLLNESVDYIEICF